MMNDYNIDDQVKLIKLAEYIINIIKSNGPFALWIENDCCSDDLISFYEDIEEQVINVIPSIFDSDSEEDE